MKQLTIICEGQTEKIFVEKLLRGFLFENDIFLHSTLIERSGGGIVKWSILKKQIVATLKSNTNSFVTTFIDLYGINKGHSFPNWKDIHSVLEQDKYNYIHSMEQGMKDALGSNLAYRFIPYIQLHEFEALLFASSNPLVYFDGDINALNQIANQYQNIELINGGKFTHPSKRWQEIINGYEKILHSDLIAENIGLSNIRSKACHFNEWIEALIRI